MKTHKFASYFPAMDEVEFKELVGDIKQNGLIEPITLYEGKILDGVHREKACKLAKVEPRYEEWADSDPLKWVMSKNLHRRHLEKGQRVMVLIDAGLIDPTDIGGGDKKSDHYRNSDGDLSKSDAAEIAGVNPELVSQVRTVAREAPELADEIRKGDISANLAHKMVQVRQRGKEYNLRPDAEKLVQAMQDERIGHNAVRDLLGAMTVAWEAGDKARVKELFQVDRPEDRTTAEDERLRQQLEQAKKSEEERKGSARERQAKYDKLPEVKWILDFLKSWDKAIDKWKPAMVKMSPEAMRFMAVRIRNFIAKLTGLADELEQKGKING